MQTKYRGMKNLFLRQSYLDAWEDYVRSIRKASFPRWDYVVLTSSNEAQAQAFRNQIQDRLDRNVLPSQTRYLVLPDPDGKRVGSGGATFHVLRVLSEQEGLQGDFHGKRILVIHSGGDSKRIPQYSVCGKLFSPVPRELPDGRGSTLFDEFLIAMAGMPARFKEGMLVLSGDVLLLFNPLQIDSQFSGAAAISIKGDVQVGTEHGVFLNDGQNRVGRFLHKQQEEVLRAVGAVNEQNAVALDTGAILLDAELLETLYGLISQNGKIDLKAYDRFVNDRARISFYGDFLYPLAADGTLEEYLREQPEGELCPELLECRRDIWEALKNYRMKLISLSPAEFIHFGTTGELLSLLNRDIGNYSFLDWKLQVFTNADPNQCLGAIHDGLLESTVRTKEGSYAENCRLTGDTVLRKGAVVSGMELAGCRVPEHTVLHGVLLGKEPQYLVRIYGVMDNPKKTFEEKGSFLEGNLADFLDKNELSLQDVWEGDDHSLWTAKLYRTGSCWREAAEAAMDVWQMSQGIASQETVEAWKRAKRFSLQESFALADTREPLRWKEELEDRILIEKFLEALRRGEHYIPALKIFGENELKESQYNMLMELAPQLPFSLRIRVLYAVSRSMKYQKRQYGGNSYDAVEQRCFEEIQQAVADSMPDISRGNFRIIQDQVKVTLPVRVNWGGGWTDTAPYCNENGGVVLNAAIRLNGREPIEAEVRRLPERKVEFASVDYDAYGEAWTAEEIQDCHNPYDPFVLHKAALIACGIVPAHGNVDLNKILSDMGGGIYISTRVRDVPKGSGLGTSSILAGACVKALGKFLGREWTDQQIYETVLYLEQIMSTGGGWQDQAGGLTPGIKYITSRPGMKQELSVEQVKVPQEALAELQERFALIYTGQRRLARNLLREVVGNYIGGRPESVEALKEMERTAVLMKFALERGHVDEFASLLNHHWEISKQLDGGCTNTCIEQIFAVCEDLIDGRFIAGAGGGGFLQVILKKGVSREQLRERLHRVFQDSGVEVWEGEMV